MNFVANPYPLWEQFITRSFKHHGVLDCYDSHSFADRFSHFSGLECSLFHCGSCGDKEGATLRNCHQLCSRYAPPHARGPVRNIHHCNAGLPGTDSRGNGSRDQDRTDGLSNLQGPLSIPRRQGSDVELAGDDLYVDAHILKWKPIVNILGMHTDYELDRVAGRYADIADERTKARTIFPLTHEKPLNMFSLRQRYRFLEPLVDAEYGSASFVTADRPAELELRISTTGLLIRTVPTK